MTLKEQLKEDLKISMKSGNTIKKNIIRVIMSEIAAEDSRRKLGQNKLDDIGVQSIIKSMAKNIDQKTPEDLKTEEIKEELKILNSYLPTLMPEEETKIKVQEVIAEVGATSIAEMGKVMGAFTKKYQGKANNKLVSRIVRETLLSY